MRNQARVALLLLLLYVAREGDGVRELKHARSGGRNVDDDQGYSVATRPFHWWGDFVFAVYLMGEEDGEGRRVMS